jgi:hypothetical protein
MSAAQLDTPVALILFRRPEVTARSFAAIAEARPRRLFLVADGPRPGRPDDEQAVAAARAVVERVDWPCAVTRLYAERNLGLRARVESGLEAVFAAVERAIIVEDDCVPEPSFFPYCEELLARYEGDPRVMAISGDSFQPRAPTPFSYYFSRYPHCWGWATWRRAWARYDGPMAEWPALREGPWLRELLGERRAAARWRAVFDDVYAGRLNTWALRWTYSCWRAGGLTALPAVNLVANIGHGPQGTHTTTEDAMLANMPTRPLELPLRHPPAVTQQLAADAYTQRLLFDPGLGRKLAWRLRWARAAVRRLLARQGAGPS